MVPASQLYGYSLPAKSAMAAVTYDSNPCDNVLFANTVLDCKGVLLQMGVQMACEDLVNDSDGTRMQPAAVVCTGRSGQNHGSVSCGRDIQRFSWSAGWYILPITSASLAMLCRNNTALVYHTNNHSNLHLASRSYDMIHGKSSGLKPGCHYPWQLLY